MNIGQQGPSETLQSTASEIDFYGKIEEAEAVTQSDGQSYIDDKQTHKEHGYDTDIRLLIQDKIAALGGRPALRYSR